MDKIPPTGILVAGATTSVQLTKIYKLYDQRSAEGRDVQVIDLNDIDNYPGYNCTHYLFSFRSTICLVEKARVANVVS